MAQVISARDYGPGASVVDTSRPFRVAIKFEEEAGRWARASITLRGAGGGALSLAMAPPAYLSSLTPELQSGMRLVFSYWYPRPSSTQTHHSTPKSSAAHVEAHGL